MRYKEYFVKNIESLDPIEGFWFARDGSRFAIFREEKEKFIAILQSDNVDRWQRGQVKAEFTKLDDGSYSVIYYNEKHYPLHINVYERGVTGGARIRRGLILHMPPFSWGKEYPIDQNSLNTIDASDPRKPVFRMINEKNVLISISSHSPEYAPVLDEFISTYKDQIESAKNLIIDLRGDEGGSVGTTNSLIQYMFTKNRRPDKFWIGDQRYVLSSKSNLNYFIRAEKEGWAPKYLVKRLESNLGELITFSDPGTVSESEDLNLEGMKKPENIAILMDSGIVSAGEAFIIKAMRYKKVTLFGQPTAGVIDYQSTSVTGYRTCPELGVYFGYPMFAASKRLPAGGVNKTGLIPDVQIGEYVKDPIRLIVDHYK